jgi:hypothetical protein
MQYKCVPAPAVLEVDRDGDYKGAVRSFADLINKETKGGWEFHSMENVVVKKKHGCLLALFGLKESYESFNMLVFSNANANTQETSDVVDTPKGTKFDQTIGMSDALMAVSNAPDDSVSIKSGQTLSGVIGPDDRDRFHVVVAQPGRLSIKVTTDEKDGLSGRGSSVNVLDLTRKKIISTSAVNALDPVSGAMFNASGIFEFPYTADVDLPSAGTYVIEIKSNNIGKYYLTVQY